VLEYGLNCPCHGVQRFSSREARDKAAITYQCRPEWFRVGDDTKRLQINTPVNIRSAEKLGLTGPDSELYVGMYD
jgi:hypothetical protein